MKGQIQEYILSFFNIVKRGVFVTFHLNWMAGSSWKSLSEYSFMRILDLCTLKYNKDWYRASEFGTGSGLTELKGAVGPFLFFWGFYAQLFCSPRYFWSWWTICSSYFVSSSSIFFVHCIVGQKSTFLLWQTSVFTDFSLFCSVSWRLKQTLTGLDSVWSSDTNNRASYVRFLRSIISETHKRCMKMSQCGRFILSPASLMH